MFHRVSFPILYQIVPNFVVIPKVTLLKIIIFINKDLKDVSEEWDLKNKVLKLKLETR